MSAAAQALAQIEAAFAGAPRPANSDLLHPACKDDNDIVGLYPVVHWRDLDDATIEGEYAAPFFLSPAGFRHFFPAFMRHALRHPASGAAAVDTAVFALTPGSGNLLEFSLSKFSLFDQPQRDAVLAFLEALAEW